MVEIEYCGGWGYASRYRDLERQIVKKVPTAKVSGTVGRRIAFEIKVNDTVIHSKLKTMAFPDFKEVIEICQEVSKGGAATQVTKT